MSLPLLALLALTACTGDTDDSAADTDTEADTDTDTDADTDSDTDTDTAPPCDPQWIPADASGPVTVATADLGGPGATGVVTWNAPGSGTLLLCHDTYRINVVAGSTQELTIGSANAAWPATLDGEASATLRTDGATSLTVTDVTLEGELPLHIRCMNHTGDCWTSGGTSVTLTDVVVEAGAVHSDNQGAMLTVTGTTFRARPSYTSAAVDGHWHTIAADDIAVSGYAAGGFRVSAHGPTQTFTNSTFSDITGGVGGNAIELQMGSVFTPSTITLTGTTFTNNDAGGWYTVYVTAGGHITVDGGTFVDNTGNVAIDVGGGPSTVSNVTVDGQLAGGGVQGVPDTWTNIDCDGIFDSCVKLRQPGGSNPSATATIQDSTMVGGTNYAVQIMWTPYVVTLSQVDFGSGTTANDLGDVAYGGNFYDYTGLVSTLTCSGGTCL